jgi:hypothetical protein
VRVHGIRLSTGIAGEGVINKALLESSVLYAGFLLDLQSFDLHFCGLY